MRETARVATAVEREVVMGFEPHHTKPILGRANRKQRDSWLGDSERCAAIGNSFHTLSTSVLLARCLEGLGHFGAGWTLSSLQERFAEEVAASDLARPRDREDMEPPASFELASLPALAPALPGAEADEAGMTRGDLYTGIDEDAVAPPAPVGQGRSQEVRLVEHYIRRVDARGADVRLDIGHVFQPKPRHRVGVETGRWRWKHVVSKFVKPKLHINALELAVVSLALRWRLRSRARAGRMFHLCDSQVCLAVLTKGRTSSAHLRGTLRRIGARLVGGGLVATFAFVSSEKNPADAPSRGI